MAIITITGENFEEEVLNSGETTLLDFWADWCGPCKRLSPVLEELAGEGVRIGKVNVDEEMSLARAFDVMSIPYLVVMRGGKPVASALGAMPKEDVRRLLEEGSQSGPTP
jgi:thioredoxin 1